MHFQGFIKNVRYEAHLAESLREYTLDDFDINEAKSYGVIKSSEAQMGFSKWVSPKRTRSYPFERIYNTFNCSKSITVIPVIKDEGRDGDLDKIQFSTISWMNLLNVYIVLGYYETASKNRSSSQSHREKLTKQLFNATFINEQIRAIFAYKQSALHWNKHLFETRFAEIFQTALQSYQEISGRTGVAIHSQEALYKYLSTITADFERFKSLSLKGSQSASNRELQTHHALELLSDGAKATFALENYLGGVYYLTADEVFYDNETLIIQESKNSTRGFLPSLSDIRDGLFKLVLFSNIDELRLDGVKTSFRVRLKCTGQKLDTLLKLPCSTNEIEAFVNHSRNKGITPKQRDVLNRLNAEAQANSLEISIGGVSANA